MSFCGHLTDQWYVEGNQPHLDPTYRSTNLAVHSLVPRLLRSGTKNWIYACKFWVPESLGMRLHGTSSGCCHTWYSVSVQTRLRHHMWWILHNRVKYLPWSWKGWPTSRLVRSCRGTFLQLEAFPSKAYVHCIILHILLSIGGPNVWQENDERCSRVQRAEGYWEQSDAGFTKSDPIHHEGKWSDTIDRLNPVCYVALYFEHKLHIDSNEKLIKFGVTRYFGKIVGFVSMPIKKDLYIYESVFRYNAI